MYHRIIAIYHSLDEHLQEVVKGASIALVLKVLATGLAFSFNIVLARLLGAEGAGLYFLALSITSIMAVVGRVGLDNTFVRFTASNVAIDDWEAVKGLYRQGTRLALIASSIVAIVMFLAAPWLANSVFSKPVLTDLIRWMALAIIPVVLFNTHAQLLKGLKRIRDHIIVLSIALPLFSLLGIIILIPFKGLEGAIWAYILAASITAGLGIGLWRKNTSKMLNLKGQFDISQLLQSCIPLFWVSLLRMVINWTPVLMLGIWVSNAEVGIFSIANRTAMLVNFTLTAVNSIAAPKFAALHQQGNVKALAHIAQNSAKLMTLAASPMLLLFLFAPEWILALFGAQFIEGGLALSILAMGQFINVVTGSVSAVLVMSGYERLQRNILILCAFLCIVLNTVLIPNFGIIGAALATAITLAAKNLVAAMVVWQRMGIRTLPKIM